MNKTSRLQTKILFTCGLLSAATLALSACANSGNSANSADPGSITQAHDTITYATGDAEPTCLDPHVGGNYPQALIGSQIFESLVAVDANGKITPWIATAWQNSADGLTWDFTLDPERKFSDGTTVDAAAIKASIEHLQDPNTASSTGYLAVKQITDIQVVSPTQVRFQLSRPDAALLESLAQPWAAIQAPSGIAQGKDKNCVSPIGSGPFKVDNWVKQDRIELSRNENFTSGPNDFGKPAALAAKKLVWRIIPDATTRYQALQSGQVQVIDNPLPDQIRNAKAGGAIKHLEAPRPGASNRLELHSGQTPFNDPKVREAFIAASNIDAGFKALFAGVTERSHSALSSVEPLGVSHPEFYKYDIDKANKLLDEAGWMKRGADGIRIKDGKPLTVRFPVTQAQSTQAEIALFEQLQASAKAAGFDVKITLLDLGAWYKALGAHEYELVSAPYTKIGPDVLRFLFHSDATVPAPSGYFANHSFVKDAELDKLLEIIGTDSTPDTRAAAARKAQQLIAEKALILPIYDQQNHFLYSDKLAGFAQLTTVGTPWLAGTVYSK